MANLSLKKALFSVGLFAIFHLPSMAEQPKQLSLVTEPFPPFNYLDGQKVTGPSREIIETVCNNLNITCEFKIYPWRRAIKMAENGEVDGIFSVGWRVDRAVWLHYSLAIVETEYGFFAFKQDPIQYQRPSDLNGYTVGTYGPSNTSRSLEKIVTGSRTAEMVIEKNPVQSLKKLNQFRYGSKALVFANRDVGNYLIRKNNLKKIHYIGKSTALSYYLGFPKSRVKKDFVDQFNQHLQTLHDNGTVQTILKRYDIAPIQGSIVPPEIPTD